MSLARLITNLTLVLQKKVDDNYIDDITMLNILSDTLNKFSVKSYNADIDLYKQIIPSTINNNVNITIKTDTIKENVLLSKTTTANSDEDAVTKRQSWCDIESDDEWTPNSNIYINDKNDNNGNVDNNNNDNNTNTHNNNIKTYNNDDNNNDDNNNDDNNNNIKTYNNKYYTNNTSKNHNYNYYEKNKKKEQQRQQKIKPNNISESVLQKFQKNCEKTITYFIHNYKTDHIDSAHSIEDLNLIIIRLLGINLEDEQPQAYTNVCWFMRNTKCYYTECTANNYNMCTYAHPRNNKTIQYCCVNEDEYDTWPENYYKCLKLDYNDNINEYIKKNGNNPLPLNTYKYIPISIIEWYSEMIEVLKE